MTVVELIEKLAEYPPDMPVYCYEDGVNELFEIEWVGEMAEQIKEGVAGVVVHHSQPSETGEWIARA